MFKGTSASAGIGIGKAVIVEEAELVITRNEVADAEAEIQRFKGALEKTIAATQKMADDLASRVGEKEAEIMQGHMMLLMDPMLTGEIETAITGESICAEYAIEQVCTTYADMFATLINGWRAEWKQGDFPFYYCQIAPYDYGIITEKGKEVINSAYLREAQAKVEHRVSNSGMAVLLDAGMEKGIHPAKKQAAGERLALLALTKTYGIEGVNGESPYYKSIEIKNDTIVVSFERANMWISGKNCFESKNFQVAGEDKVFYPAKAWIERSKMLVKSDKVPHPVAVRYGFENYVEGDVYCDGLPLGSFRSDDW